MTVQNFIKIVRTVFEKVEFSMKGREKNKNDKKFGRQQKNYTTLKNAYNMFFTCLLFKPGTYNTTAALNIATYFI